MWTLVLFFISVDASAGADNTEVVKVMEGSLLRLNTDTEQLTQILWTFHNSKQSGRVAQYHGNIYTHYDDRFNGRVELDQHTGNLNISNINTDDSGLYKALIVNNKQISIKKYKVDVYAPIPLPDISHVTVQQPPSTSQEIKGFCSLVCSIKNDRDVFISWFKEDKIVNQSHSSDLSINLSLPLKLLYNNTESYSCTAANPVSNKSISLHMKHFCPHYEDCQQHCGHVEVLIRLILSALVGIATVVFLVEHMRSA